MAPARPSAPSAQAQAQAPPAKKRRLRKGARKSKAERLARRAAEPPSAEALAALAALLASDASDAWDAAQLQAQRLGTSAAKERVVTEVLWTKTAPRAAAHYARRLELDETATLRVLCSPAHTDGAASLLAAKFLSEVSTAVVSNAQRLERFLWPWLIAHAKVKSASGAPSEANEEAVDSAHRNDGDDENAAKAHAAQAFGAAIRLLLLPPSTPVCAKQKSASAADRHAEREELQRLLVLKCLATGEFLHYVPAFADAFRESVDRAIEKAARELDEQATAVLCQEEATDAEMQAEQALRQSVAERIEVALRLMWPDARVLVFGSSATGLLHFKCDDNDNSNGGRSARRSSDDLDLCVLIPSNPVFRQHTESLVVEMKEHLSVYLLECEDLLAIEGARVPIVQFTDPASQIRCDICVNNLPALWNTQLMKQLLCSDSRSVVVRLLSLWLKRWRRAKQKLFGKGLSSYGLQLLVLHYFQQRGVLPTFSLADECVETQDALASFSWEAVDATLEAAQVESPRAKHDPEKTARLASFWSVLADFFKFYAMEFDFEESVVSLRQLHVMTKISKGWTRKAWKAALSIEDPIEHDRDLGTLFNRKSLAKLRTAFVHACAILSQENGSREETERLLLASMPYDLEPTMAIPGVNEVLETSTASPRLRKSTSGAARDRKVKLQHFLVMKAFNLRKGKQTVSQQFQFLKKQPDNQSGRTYIELSQLCEYLSIPPFRRLVLCQVFELAPSDERLDFDRFVRFLQSTAAQAADEEKELQRKFSASSLPDPPTLTRQSTLDRPADQESQLVCFQSSWLSSQSRFSRPPPAPGLWKKREITIQERITEYTKIDEQGQPQHLIEKEKHQTEVIHMETLDGEFAHREITQFEQTEQLNDEIVHHEHGREEFVHLKSEHDEISRFESSIPTGSGPARPEECEQPPPSPTIKRDPSAVDGGHSEHSVDDSSQQHLQPEEEGMNTKEFNQCRRQTETERSEFDQLEFDMNSMQY